MGPEYITYKDIAVYSCASSQSGAGVSIVLPQVIINPVKNILILEARVMAVATLFTGEYLEQGLFRTYWDFPEPSAPGLEVSGIYGREYFAARSGVMFEMHLMRSISAGRNFYLVPAANSFSLDVAPPAPWVGLLSVTLFYVLLN